MNYYFNNIIKKYNDNYYRIDLRDSNLTDENIYEITDLIKNNNSIQVLKIGNKKRSKVSDKYTYQLYMTTAEIDEQYQHNIENKITMNGYNHLFECLKYNNTIHTLKIYYYSSNYLNINLDSFIEKLSEMLLINKSIINLTLTLEHLIFSRKVFIKLCNALKNHNIFYSLLFHISNSQLNENDYNIFIDALQNQKYLSNLSLHLTEHFYNNDKIIELVNSLKYIYKLNIVLPYNDTFIDNIFNVLENKQYLTKLIIFIHSTNNVNSLSKLLNTNKNITYLELNNRLSSNNIINNTFKQSIINSNLQTLKLKFCDIQINDIIDIIQNNNTINNLNLSFNRSICNFKSLFDKLKTNTNITSLNISNNIIYEISDLISLKELIENNTCITKINLSNCLTEDIYDSKYNSVYLEIFNSLILNNTIDTLKISYFAEPKSISNEFIDKLTNFIKNNKNVNKLILQENNLYATYYVNNRDRVSFLNIQLLTNEQYNKIINSLNYNHNLVCFKWNELTYKEHFIM